MKLPEDKDGILAAVRLNWKLWTIIQADILDDDSLLSLEIRQNLLNLSNFIDRHTIGIITTPDAAKMPTLIDINKNIAAGLFASLRNANATETVPADAGDRATSVSPEEKISTSA